MPVDNTTSSIFMHSNTFTVEESAFGALLGAISVSNAKNTSAIDDAFKHLANSVRAGNPDSIEIMQQLALRNDDLGKKAETLLFDLFSGKEKAAPHIVEEIQAQSFELYEKITSGFGDLGAQDKSGTTYTIFALDDKDVINAKLTSPSKLLYMAGSGAAKALSNGIQSLALCKIADIFREKAPTNTLTISPKKPAEFWSHGRFIDDTEVNYLAQKYTKDCDLHLATCISIENPQGIVDLNHDALKNPENNCIIIPINIKNHWVTFCLYNDAEDGNNKKALFFSSIKDYYNLDFTKESQADGELLDQINLSDIDADLLADLTEQMSFGIEDKGTVDIQAESNVDIQAGGAINIVKDAINVITTFWSVNEITCIEDNLQGNAPNACGLFTVEVIKHIAQGIKTGKNPVATVQEFVSNFKGKSIEDQEEFNLAGRRQIHGAFIESPKAGHDRSDLLAAL